MLVMQATPSAQGTPATPAPATAPAAVIAPPPAPRPLTDREIRAIRDRRSALSDQLINVSDRRERLVNQLSETPAAAQAGILDRIAQLDRRILGIEAELEQTGRMITSGQGVFATTAPPARFPLGLSEETFAPLAALFTIVVFGPMSLALARIVWRRTRAAPRHAAESHETAARMERIEQAVDAIAIEVERVGEAQRYQARILAEAQLMPALGAPQPAAEPLRVPQYDPVPRRAEPAS
jgi:hypothetical protein